MRDNQELMLKFVAIVEKFPEVYDSSRKLRTRQESENAWDKIAACVRTEINEECTAEELKIKWKGIRSSFSRFKKKLLEANSEKNLCRKYYLYDSLQYLDKFTEPKLTVNDSTLSQASFNFDDGNNSIEYVSNLEDWEEHDAKPVISNIISKHINANEIDTSDSDTYKPNKSTKRKPYDNNAMKRDTEENEDMQFFRSILPDIKNFTSKEKRRFKMSILQLIDEIEDDRKKLKSSNEVSSS